MIAISKEKIDAKAHRAKGEAKDKIYTKNGSFSLSTSDKKLQFFKKCVMKAIDLSSAFTEKQGKKTICKDQF